MDAAVEISELVTYLEAISQLLSDIEKYASLGKFNLASIKANKLAIVSVQFNDANAFFAARVMEMCFDLLKGLNDQRVEKKFLASITQESSSLVKTITLQLTSTSVDLARLYEAERDLRWLPAKNVDMRNELAAMPRDVFSIHEDVTEG